MVLVACTIGASMFYHEYSKLENSCKLLKRLDDSNKRFRASMKELATAQLGALRAGHINMENGACELLQMIVMADVQPEDIGTTYHEIIRLSQKTATLWLHE